MRWRHPENGMVPPAIFIPVAEEIGLIEPLGHWVIAQACRDARDWPVATISINVSPVQLRNPHFADAGDRRSSSEAGIEPSRVEFEITETAAHRGHAAMLGQLAAAARIRRADRARRFRHRAIPRSATSTSSRSTGSRSTAPSSTGSTSSRTAARSSRRWSTWRARAASRPPPRASRPLEQKAFLQRIGCDDLQGFLMASPIPAREIDALLGRTEPSWRLRQAAG